MGEEYDGGGVCWAENAAAEGRGDMEIQRPPAIPCEQQSMPGLPFQPAVDAGAPPPGGRGSPQQESRPTLTSIPVAHICPLAVTRTRVRVARGQGGPRLWGE